MIDQGWLSRPQPESEPVCLWSQRRPTAWKTDLGGIVVFVAGGGRGIVAGGSRHSAIAADADRWRDRQSDVDRRRGPVASDLDSSVVVAGDHVIVAEANGHFIPSPSPTAHTNGPTAPAGAPGLASPVVVGIAPYVPLGDLRRGDAVTWRRRSVAGAAATGAAAATNYSVDITAPRRRRRRAPGGRVVLSSLASADGRCCSMGASTTASTRGTDGVRSIPVARGVVAIDAGTGPWPGPLPTGPRLRDPNQIPTTACCPLRHLSDLRRRAAGLVAVASTWRRRCPCWRCAPERGEHLVLPSATRASPGSRTPACSWRRISARPGAGFA